MSKTGISSGLDRRKIEKPAGLSSKERRGKIDPSIRRWIEEQRVRVAEVGIIRPVREHRVAVARVAWRLGDSHRAGLRNLHDCLTDPLPVVTPGPQEVFVQIPPAILAPIRDVLAPLTAVFPRDFPAPVPVPLTRTAQVFPVVPGDLRRVPLLGG